MLVGGMGQQRRRCVDWKWDRDEAENCLTNFGENTYKNVLRATRWRMSLLAVPRESLLFSALP